MDNPTHLQEARQYIERNAGSNAISAYDLRNALAHVIAHLERRGCVGECCAPDANLQARVAKLEDELTADKEPCTITIGESQCECCDEEEDSVGDELHETLDDALAHAADIEVTTRVDRASGVMRHSLKVDWVS